ncbi:methyltransferase domain-containing protein [Pannus brasiliensis CCIBt3594]|uniref:Methyltransferase domain-containing protein n=1 Tax=Pannus brasiliensis CCIBt3594 TaxID=1427578 RepID=A0AAW9QDP8_9CHRO
MATILRALSYQHQWLYDGISRLAALAVGGEGRFRQLALSGLAIEKNTRILDLCCGAGQTTRYLADRSDHCTGLDVSPVALERARKAVPGATYVEGLAEKTPFADGEFDLVHTSAALHEMEPRQLREILEEVYRILRPGGIFALVDFHAPTNPLFWPSLALFLGLFETRTAWQFIDTDLASLLQEVGFRECKRELHAGGSLQVIQATK